MDANNWKFRLTRDVLTPPYLDRIGCMLSSDIGNGYEQLADSFGYSTEEVAAFRVRDPNNPGRVFLECWLRRSDSTINVLITHLERQSRHDVIVVLQELKDPTCMLVLSVDNRLTRTVEVKERTTVRDAWSQLCAEDEGFRSFVENSDLEYCGDTHLSNVWETTAGKLKKKRNRPLTGPPRAIHRVVKPEQSQSDSREYSVHRHGMVATDVIGAEYLPLMPNVADSRSSPGSLGADSATSSVSTLSLRSSSDDQREDVVESRNTPVTNHQDLPGYHQDATSNEQIGRVMALYLSRDGWYILRPSRDPVSSALCISITYRGEIVSFRVHTTILRLNSQHSTEYYLFDRGPRFRSVQDLVDHYQHHIMEPPGREGGPRLKKPIV